MSRLRLQRFAASLASHGGLSSCLWMLAFGASGVSVRGLPKEGGGFEKVRLGNLSVCGSHLCPVCGPRIAHLRREEIGHVIRWAERQGFWAVMITLTTAHKAGDALPPMVAAQKKAMRAWRQHRAYKRAAKAVRGSVSAYESTLGAAGFHPHAHLLYLIEADTERRALRVVAGMRRAWTAAAKAQGLHAGRAGFHAQGAGDAADYMAKWEAADEMARAPSKAAKRGGRTVHQLLRDAYAGDTEAAARWAEWARATKGKGVLPRFSPGLRERAGVAVVSDRLAAVRGLDPHAFLIHLIEGAQWERAKAGGLDRDTLTARAAAEGRAGVMAYVAETGAMAPAPADVEEGSRAPAAAPLGAERTALEASGTAHPRRGPSGVPALGHIGRNDPPARSGREEPVPWHGRRGGSVPPRRPQGARPTGPPRSP